MSTLPQQPADPQPDVPAQPTDPQVPTVPQTAVTPETTGPQAAAAPQTAAEQAPTVPQAVVGPETAVPQTTDPQTTDPQATVPQPTMAPQTAAAQAPTAPQAVVEPSAVMAPHPVVPQPAVPAAAMAPQPVVPLAVVPQAAVPMQSRRPAVIGRLAAAALLGAGLGAAAVGVAHTQQPGGTASQVSVGLAASSTDRSAVSVVPDLEVHGRHLQGMLRDVTGRQVGWIRFTATGGRSVLVQVHATHLTPGFHGIHVHSVGICDPAGAKPFTSAGPHLNPGHTAEGMQAGVLPVLLANPDGTADARFLDAHFTLADLTGPTGASVVVHAAPDNYANIPTRYRSGDAPGPDAETQMTGDSGARFACAVVARPTTTPHPTGTSSTGTGMPPGMGMPAGTQRPTGTSTGAPSSTGTATGTPTGVPSPTGTGAPGTGGTPGMTTPATPTSPATAPSPTTQYGQHW